MTATNVISIAMHTATDVGIRRYDGPIVADPAALDDPRVDSTTWENWARTCLDTGLVTLRGLRFAARRHAARHHHADAVVPWAVEITHDRVRRQQAHAHAKAATEATREIWGRLLAWSGDLSEVFEIMIAAHRNYHDAKVAEAACRGKTTRTAKAAGISPARCAYDAAMAAYALVENDAELCTGPDDADQQQIESAAFDYGYDYLAAAREHLLSLCRRIDAAEGQP